jgi:DNA polymerase delta subunit 1
MNVTHFDPYFYIPCPRGFTSNELEPFKNYLNVRLCDHIHIPTLNRLHRKFQGVTTSYEQNLSRSKVFGATKETHLSVSSRSLPSTRGIYPRFEISTVQAPRVSRPYLSTRVFERGQCSYRDMFGAVVPTFESNIAYTLRFMIDTKVVGMNWIEVPAGNYTLVSAKKSKCQIEIFVRYVCPRNTSPVGIQEE